MSRGAPAPVPAPPVRVGQVWASRDRRDAGRRVTVEQLDETFVWVRSVRRSRMRRGTLTGRYRLVSHPPIVTVSTAGERL